MLGLGTILGSVLGAISNAINTRQVNKTNLAIAQMTNANNRQLVEMQNKAAKEESELAYRRSSAPNQVRLMQQAGMSRAGAINALNGGGSYTPAPVNTSQDQSATMQTADLGALANVGQALESLAQRKHEKQMQAQQLAAQKEMQEQQLASSERIARLNADTTNRNSDNRLHLDREIWNKQMELVDKNIEQVIANIAKTNKETESIALDNVRKDLENKNYPTLARLTNEKLSAEIEVLAKQAKNIQSQTDINEKQKEILQLQKRFTELTQKHQIDAVNAANELITYISSQDLSMMQDSVGKDYMYALIFIMKYCMPQLFRPN